MASHGKLELYRFLKRKLKEFKAQALKPKRLLTGHDLIHLGIKPGPIMKEILAEAYTLQLEGKVKSCDEAMTWVRQAFKKEG